MLDRLFKLKEHGTTTKTELMAGLTTFLTMAYIIFVNPFILSKAGMPADQVTTATILAAAFGTLLVGIWANVPLAMAPGMGLNAFFAFSLVDAGIVPDWQTALGVVFFSGIFFLIITLFGAREKIINAIPLSLRLAVAGGIGLFITFIGLQKMGVVVPNKATMLGLGNYSTPVLISVIGLISIVVLEIKKFKGSILVGVIIATILSLLANRPELPGDANKLIPLPETLADYFSAPAPLTDIFMAINFTQALTLGLIGAAFSFMFVDLFDSVGTIMACAHNADMVDENGKIQQVDKILEADAVATVVGACLGTSTTTTYIESGSGIAAGGRTGLTSVTVAVLFLLCLLFTGFIAIVPGYAVAPALVMVGIHMFRNIKEINFSDLEVAIPAFLTMIIMPLTYNISLGICFGFLSYIIISVAAGNYKKICPTMWIIGILSLIQLALEWKVVDFYLN